MKGIMTVIPPITELLHRKRIAAYCRVSTDSVEQKHSYEMQKQYFSNLYRNKPDCELVDIYADLGLSGTKADSRPELQRLLDDCRRGKIDRVVCKSISRFARNTKDCLTILRELKLLGVTAAFEKEGIDTARISDEIMVTIMEGLAQEESASISRNVRWSIQRKMASGTLKVARVPYGYMKDSDGNLMIDEPKALVIRRIFDLYLNGIGARKIAAILNDGRIPSPTNKLWNQMTILKMLRQEKYIGDVLWQKTYSEFMGVHDKINHGDVDSYYVLAHHPAIIPQKMFQRVQEIMAKNRHQVNIHENPFRGYIRCICGRSYYLVDGAKPYWICCGQYDPVRPCEQKQISHTALKNAWRRLCQKLRVHGDKIYPAVILQLERLRENRLQSELKALEFRLSELRQQRYLLCRLCAEGCISHEKYLLSAEELETEINTISEQMQKVQYDNDTTVQMVQQEYRYLSTASAEDLIPLILDKAVSEDGQITFHLKSGLYFREVL